MTTGKINKHSVLVHKNLINGKILKALSVTTRSVVHHEEPSSAFLISHNVLLSILRTTYEEY